MIPKAAFWAFLSNKIAYSSSDTVRSNQSNPGNILHLTMIKKKKKQKTQNLLPQSRRVDSSLLEILQLFKVHFIEFFYMSYRIIILIKVRSHHYLFGVNIYLLLIQDNASLLKMAMIIDYASCNSSIISNYLDGGFKENL